MVAEKVFRRKMWIRKIRWFTDDFVLNVTIACMIEKYLEFQKEQQTKERKINTIAKINIWIERMERACESTEKNVNYGTCSINGCGYKNRHTWPNKTRKKKMKRTRTWTGINQLNEILLQYRSSIQSFVISLILQIFRSPLPFASSQSVFRRDS